MAQNAGKIFESDFKKSVPSYVLVHRLNDAAQSFGGNGKLRFSCKNPFDFMLWDSKRHILYALELKTVKDKSISFEREEDEKQKKEIHWHQIQGLNKWNEYDGVSAGFVIEFREIETTVFIHIKDFNSLIAGIDKKSFSYSDLVNSGLPYLIIPQEKKITRYTYNIEEFLERKGEANE